MGTIYDPATGFAVGDDGQPDVVSTSAGDTIASKDPGILNSVAADTIGILWRAASGTVDPWTKREIAYRSGAGVLGGNSYAGDTSTVDQIDQQAQQSVTDTLVKQNADPSQFFDGLANSLKKLGALSLGAIAIAGLVVIGFLVLSRPR